MCALFRYICPTEVGKSGLLIHCILYYIYTVYGYVKLIQYLHLPLVIVPYNTVQMSTCLPKGRVQGGVEYL